MGDNNFTWVKTYKELTNYLRNKEDSTKELVELLKSVGIGPFNDKSMPMSDFDIELDEIDPFTFYCYINKYGSDRRLIYLQEIASKLGMSIPTDDFGLPTAQAQKVWLFPYKYDRTNNEIARLWQFFNKALDQTLTDADFADVLQIKSSGKTKLTEVLFYIAPERYLPINKPTIPYIQEQLGIKVKYDTYSEYITLLEAIKSKITIPFYELSYEAWKWNDKPTSPASEELIERQLDSNCKYWMYVPGENASEWDNFYSDGIMGLGWDYLGDLNDYKNKGQIVLRLQELEKTTGSKKNDATANWEFKSIIKPGDIIIAKKGSKEYIGYGIVCSDYIYDDTRNSYKKIRKVDWKKRGSWLEDHKPIVLKTLTDITKYTDYVNKLIQLIGIEIETPLIMKSLAKYPLNQILYGPPGTGKTYNTINKALQIIGANIDGKSRTEIKELFNSKVEEGQIVFTTFHQSMSYEDFIEGIKPEMDDVETNELHYKIEDGIFKRMCVDSAFSFVQQNKTKETEEAIGFSERFDQFVEYLSDQMNDGSEFKLETPNGGFVLVDSISQNNNIVIKYSKDGTKYIVSKNRLGKLSILVPELSKVKSITAEFRKAIGGCTPTPYWAVLNAIRKQNQLHTRLAPITETNEYNYKDKKSIVETIKKSEFAFENKKKYVLIIDEINRGNVSQIFGELITLIEEDKRLGNPEALEVLLPYSKEKFGVPPNLHIIGTMNTADRSVEALDAALRRRFSFEEMEPKPKLIRDYGKANDGIVDNIDLVKVLETINSRLEVLLDKDHKIGHSYFMCVSNVKELQSAFQNKIIPLLQEYFFGDYGKIGLVLGSGFLKVSEKNSDKLFADFKGYDSSDFSERVIYKTANVEDEDFDIQTAIMSLLNN